MPGEKRKYSATIKVAEIKQGGQSKDGKREFISFIDAEGKRYSVWDDELKPYIKEGAEAKVDIIETPNDSGNGPPFYYNVNQIYIDGQPVKQKSRGNGKASPQQIASEEVRAAVSVVLANTVPLMNDEQLHRFSNLANKAMDWCEAHLEAPLAPAPASAPPSQQPAVSSPTPGSTAEAWGNMDRGDAVPEFKNAGDFFTKVHEVLGLTQSAALSRLEVTRPSEMKDFPTSWRKLVELKKNTEGGSIA